MEFIDEKLDNYVVSHTSKENDLLYSLNRETYMKVLQPRMLSGHFQGRVLSMLSKMIKPQNKWHENYVLFSYKVSYSNSNVNFVS